MRPRLVFGSPALITLVGLFVLCNGLRHSGALDRLRELLASPRIRNHSQLMLVFGFVEAPISGLILNPLIVAMRCRALPQMDFEQLWPTTSRWCS